MLCMSSIIKYILKRLFKKIQKVTSLLYIKYYNIILFVQSVFKWHNNGTLNIMRSILSGNQERTV